MIIKIVHEQHFIEGDTYKVFLYLDDKSCICCLTANVKPKDYLDMCEKLDGLKIRLEQLGNNVETITKFEADPNFETAAEAEEYMANKGY